MSEKNAKVKESRGRGKSRSEPKAEPFAADTQNVTSPTQGPLAKRPDYGKLGKVDRLWTNWFQFRFESNKPLTGFRYNVDIEAPGIINRMTSRLIFWKCIEQHPDQFPQWNSIVYDDAKQMFSLDELKERLFKITFRCPRLLHPKSSTMECSVEFQYSGPMTIDLQKAVTPIISKRDNAHIQIIDCILSQSRRCFLSEMKNWYGLTNRTFLINKDPRPKIRIRGEGMEVWTGLFSSATLGQNSRQIINIDAINGLFYCEQNLAVFALEILGRNPSDVRPFSDLDASKVKRAIEGVKFYTNHHETKRVRRAKGLDKSAREKKFINRNNENVTVESYHQSMYGKELVYPQFPTICAGPQNKYAFPMELCWLDHPQRVPFRKQNEKITAEIIKITRKDPTDRKNEIQQLMRNAQLLNRQDPFLRTFNLNINQNMLEVDGRVLPPPRIAAAVGTGNSSLSVYQGEWKYDGKQFAQPGQCLQFGFICFQQRYRPLEQWQFKKFCSSLVGSCHKRGMNFTNDDPLVAQFSGVSDLERAFAEIVKESNADKLSLIFICVYGKDTTVYGQIKRLGDQTHGIPTQVIQAQTIRRVLDDMRNQQTSRTLEQLILKINAKLGGVNFKTLPNGDQLWSELTSEKNPTLFIGIDVTHPAPYDENGKSIGAIVGNVDLECCRFDVSYKLQRYRREKMINIEEEMKQRFIAFYKQTRKKPKRVIIFRDGISNSQFQAALDGELENVKNVCRALNFQPLITYIVVQKRHHTRFFPKNPRDLKNVLPGTTIDTIITHPHDFDFFLCSHLSRIGTSRPAHYVVLYDESKFTADQLQSLAYRLCFMNVRCAKTASLPAPVHYADLCAYRAALYIKSARSSSTSEESTESLMQQLEINQKLRNNPCHQMYWI